MTSKRFLAIVSSALLMLSTLSVGMAASAEGEALAPAMTIVINAEDDAVKGWNFGSAVGAQEIADGVSPLGKAVKITNPTETDQYPNFSLGKSGSIASNEGIAGMAFWVKNGEKEIDFNLSLDYGCGALSRDYTEILIAEDGTRTEVTAPSNVRVPADFTGWVILPKACFSDAFNPAEMASIQFNWDPRNFLGTVFYLDSFGFYTDQDALIASVTPEQPVQPEDPDEPTQNTEENKEMWVIGGFDGEKVNDGIFWDSGVATCEKTDASPDGSGLSITPPKDCTSFEVNPRITIPNALAEKAQNGEYTGLCYWYKAPLESSGNPGLNYFEEKEIDGTYYRVCYGYNADSEYYTIDKDGVYRECYGIPALPGFEGWVFIPFDSFVRGWGNDAPGDIEFEPWFSNQLNITYNPTGEGTDGLAALYDDFAFYTSIEAVKEAFGAKDEELPTPPTDNPEGPGEDPGEDPGENPTTTDPSEDPGNESDNPDTGVTNPIIPALLLTAGVAGAVALKTRKSR